MPLKMNTEVVHQVDCFDLDRFVNETFGFPQGSFSFVATEESSNDVSHQFQVKPVNMSDDLEEWYESKGTSFVFTGDILNHLCWRGTIPAGNYVVNVCW